MLTDIHLAMSIMAAAKLMHFSPISVLYRWFYFVTTIATSIFYMSGVPKIKTHIALIVVAVLEMIAIVLASAPILAARFQVSFKPLNSAVRHELKMRSVTVKVTLYGFPKTCLVLCNKLITLKDTVNRIFF